MTHAIPRPRRGALLLLGGVATAAALLLTGADVAHAVQVQGSDAVQPANGTTPKVAGENLGALLRNLFGPVAASIGGLAGIMAIVKQDIGRAIVLVVVTGVVMMFVTPQGGDALELLSKMFAKALGA